MLDWWLENGPPVYASVAGYMGLIKPRKKKTSETDFNELMKLAGPNGMIR